jgi:hypothetical protein
MKSKVLSTHKCNYLVVGDSLDIFDGLQSYLSWFLLLDENCFARLRNELNVIDFSNMAWNQVHLLFGSLMHLLVCISSIFGAFLGYLWFLLNLASFILFSWSHMFLMSFGMHSCWFCNIWKYLWAMIQIQSWMCKSWQNSGQSEFWKRGRSAGKRRTVRRSWDLSPEVLQKVV